MTVNYGDLESGTDLKTLLYEHGFVHIKNDQPLTINQFAEFAKTLGKPLTTVKHVLDDDRIVQEVSSNELFKNNEVDWHNDWSYGVGQYNGTALYNFFGGHLTPTWFIDMKKAYDELPDKEK